MSAKKRTLEKLLMPYLHGEEPHYEPFLRALLEREQEVYERMTEEDGSFDRGERAERTWALLFEELARVITPLQMEQLVDRLSRDVKATCDLFYELTQSQKLLTPDEGTPD